MPLPLCPCHIVQSKNASLDCLHSVNPGENCVNSFYGATLPDDEHIFGIFQIKKNNLKIFFIDIIYFKSYRHSIKSTKFCFENELKVITTIVWKLNSHSLVQWPDVSISISISI